MRVPVLAGTVLDHGKTSVIGLTPCSMLPSPPLESSRLRGAGRFPQTCAVSRWALLDAFSSVDRDGTFTSKIARPRDRFLRVAARRVVACFSHAFLGQGLCWVRGFTCC